MCSTLLGSAFQAQQALIWPRGLPQNSLSVVLGLGSGLCPLATCSKQSIPATSVAMGSLEQLSEIYISSWTVQLGQPMGLVLPNLSLIVLWLELMAANRRIPGSIPGEDLKRFRDSSSYVFYIVGECFSSAADTHLAMDCTC